jgi:hypothetical protein
MPTPTSAIAEVNQTSEELPVSSSKRPTTKKAGVKPKPPGGGSKKGGAKKGGAKRGTTKKAGK